MNGIFDWLGDAWDLLAGKPQSWYDRVDRLQKAIAIRIAEVQAIGESAWEAVRSAFFSETQGPDLEFWTFGQMVDQLRAHLKTLIITKSHVPTDDQIGNVELFDQMYGRYIDYVKQMLPELRSRVETDSAEVRKALSQGSMRSPSEAGKEEFWNELSRRAKLLGAGVGTAVFLYLAIPVLLSSILSGRRG